LVQYIFPATKIRRGSQPKSWSPQQWLQALKAKWRQPAGLRWSQVGDPGGLRWSQGELLSPKVSTCACLARWADGVRVEAARVMRPV